MTNLVERLTDHGSDLALECAERAELDRHGVPDIVRGSGIKVVFLLESPDATEIRLQYPLAGSSGEAVVRKLVSLGLLHPRHSGNSIGKVVWRGDVRWLGLMNVCELPLQHTAYNIGNCGRNLELLLCRLSRTRVVNKGQLPKRRSTHTQTVQKIILCDLVARIRRVLQRLTPNPLIVPCGRFAKAALEAAKSMDANLVVDSEITGIPDPGFIPHPSYGHWEKPRFDLAFDHLKSEIANRS